MRGLFSILAQIVSKKDIPHCPKGSVCPNAKKEAVLSNMQIESVISQNDNRIKILETNLNEKLLSYDEILTKYINGEIQESEFAKINSEVKNLKAEIKGLKNATLHYKKMQEYNDKKTKHPKTAFLYDPNINTISKRSQLNLLSNVCTVDFIASKLPLEKAITIEDYFETDEFEGSLYIDMDLSHNINAFRNLSFGS